MIGLVSEPLGLRRFHRYYKPVADCHPVRSGGTCCFVQATAILKML